MAITIKYNGATIASLDPGQKATLKCSEELMASDLVVEDESVGETDINGVLEYYRVNAGAKVSAGDFVDFVTKFQNSTFKDSAVTVRGACKLDDSRVLVAYDNYAVVLTIKHDGIQVGEAVDLGATPSSIVALSSYKALFSYRSDGKVTVTVLTIDGDAISVGEPTAVYSLPDSGSISYNGYSLAALTASKALMVIDYRYLPSKDYATYSWYSYVQIIDIAGSSVTPGTPVSLPSLDRDNSLGRAALKLAEDKALVLRLTDSLVEAWVVTVKNLTPTCGTRASWGNSTYFNEIAATVLSENAAVVVISSRSSPAMYAVPMGLSNTSAAFGTVVSIHGGDCSRVSMSALSENQALVVYAYNNYGRAQVLTVDEYAITSSGQYTFDHYTVTSTALVPLSESSALVAYNNATGAIANLTVDPDSNAITADSAETGTFVQPATSRLYNVGVARNSGEEGELVAVYRVE